MKKMETLISPQEISRKLNENISIKITKEDIEHLLNCNGYVVVYAPSGKTLLNSGDNFF